MFGFAVLAFAFDAIGSSMKKAVEQNQGATSLILFINN